MGTVSEAWELRRRPKGIDKCHLPPLSGSVLGQGPPVTPVGTECPPSSTLLIPYMDISLGVTWWNTTWDKWGSYKLMSALEPSRTCPSPPSGAHAHFLGRPLLLCCAEH